MRAGPAGHSGPRASVFRANQRQARQRSAGAAQGHEHLSQPGRRSLDAALQAAAAAQVHLIAGGAHRPGHPAH